VPTKGNTEGAASRHVVDPNRWPDVVQVPRSRIRAYIAKALIRRASRRLPFRIVISDEKVSSSATTSEVKSMQIMYLYRPDLFYRRIGIRGLIGFGEAYQAGDWDTDDLPGLIAVFATQFNTLIPPLLQRLRGHSASLRRSHQEGCTIEGAWKNSHYHYDLPVGLFQSFLDETMTYSSALFLTDSSGHPLGDEEALAAAQRRKIDRMLDLVGVQNNTTLLEIGGGWGELSIRAARRGALVHSITNSAEQAKVAERRVAEAGFEKQVHVDLRDYRQLDTGGRRYDAIISIEMIEAVGEQYLPTYFTTLERLLAPEGLIGLQAIVMRHDRMMRSRRSETWTTRYIFPGGLAPSLPMIASTLSCHTGLHVLDRFAFGGHYAATLRLWRRRFGQNWPVIAQFGFDETFRRTWDFYLGHSEGGFAAGYLDVYQLLIGK
jgi:cyclopropane-fatty-acyl-phospholipid synthase